MTDHLSSSERALHAFIWHIWAYFCPSISASVKRVDKRAQFLSSEVLGGFVLPFAAEAEEGAADYRAFPWHWVLGARVTGVCLWWEVGSWHHS